MRNFRLYMTFTTVIGAALLVGTDRAGGYTPQADPDTVGPTVLITDLVANRADLIDSNGILQAPVILDPSLVNPWGVAESPSSQNRPGSPFWVSDNNAGVSTLYNVPGAISTPVSKNSLTVSIPTPVDPLGSSGTPTGAVFNVDGGASGGFKVTGVDKNGNPTSASAIFLFSTEDGTIVGWNPGVNPVGFDPVRDAARAGTFGIIAVDNSGNNFTNPDPTQQTGAVYKGLAIATDASGDTFLYTTNFRAGTVEVYKSSFAPVTTPAFTDPHLKSGYAPFNIVLIGSKLFVTYAVQDATKHDDVAGPAHGLVNTFDLSGGSLQRFSQHGHLNSPWGVVEAPASFGQFAGDILIGNFGNGRINAFDPNTGEFLGTVVNPKGQEILIDGLWTLRVGNDGNGGNSNTIYFTAGPNGETDGIFGSLTPVAPGTPCGPICI